MTMTEPAPLRWGVPDEPDDLVVLGRYRALQHEFEVATPRRGGFPDLVGELVRPFRIPRGASAGAHHRYDVRYSPTADQYVLSYDGLRVGGTIRPQVLRGTLAWHLNRTAVEASVDRFLVMHAAAVTRGGVTVVMPADQESGKTTTTAGLLREGYGYVTDEAVAVDPTTLMVAPFPKTLSLDPGSWFLFPELHDRCARPEAQQWHVPAADLGAHTWGGEVAAPSVLVLPRYVAGTTTDVEPVTPAEAAYELARMTFHFTRHPRRNLDVVSRLARHASVWRLRIGDLDEAVTAIDGLVSERILEELCP